MGYHKYVTSQNTKATLRYYSFYRFIGEQGAHGSQKHIGLCSLCHGSATHKGTISNNLFKLVWQMYIKANQFVLQIKSHLSNVMCRVKPDNFTISMISGKSLSLMAKPLMATSTSPCITFACAAFPPGVTWTQLEGKQVTVLRHTNKVFSKMLCDITWHLACCELIFRFSLQGIGVSTDTNKAGKG